MKLPAALLVCVLLSIATADPANLVDFSVTSANLNAVANVVLKVYGFNTANPLPLPICKDSLNGSTYVDYDTPVQNATNNPNWANSFSLSNYFFTTSSRLAFELWNQTYTGGNDSLVYLGGAQFTVAQLELLPQSSNVVLTDHDGLSPGFITVNWSGSN